MYFSINLCILLRRQSAVWTGAPTTAFPSDLSGLGDCDVTGRILRSKKRVILIVPVNIQHFLC